jgi:hypothetical protein
LIAIGGLSLRPVHEKAAEQQDRGNSQADELVYIRALVRSKQIEPCDQQPGKQE